MVDDPSSCLLSTTLEQCGRALAAGDFAAAEHCALDYLAEYGEHSAVRGVVGAVCMQRGDYQGAVSEYTLALKWAAMEPEGANPDLYYCIGLAHQKLGNLDKACQFWTQAVALDPVHEDAVVNGTQAALQLGDWSLALAIAQTAIQNGYETDHLWLWSGHALAKLGRDEDSIAAYGHAITLAPHNIRARFLHALALRDCRQYALARKGLDAVLALEPAHAEAAFEAAQLDLMRENWQSGFALWQARLRRSVPLLPADLPGRLWDGSYARDAVLLIQAEQGFGDTLQFFRYVFAAEQRVARVVVRVHAALVRLLQQVRPDWEIKAFDETVDADLHVPLLSLPHILDLASPCGERAEYLAEQRSAVRQTSSTGAVRIGLVWAGSPTHHNDARRSAPLSAFLKLADLPNVSFTHFQMDADTNQTKVWPDLQDGTVGVRDFYDTAQHLASCDLLISVDTAMVHLASAMAIPTWVLVPDVPDWRWGESAAATPWYPHAVIWRQTAKNDWDELLSRVREQLCQDFG